MDDDEIVYVEQCNRIEIYKECPCCGKANKIMSTFCCMEGCGSNLTQHPIKFRMKVFLILPIDQPFAKNFIFVFNNEPTLFYQEEYFVSGPRLTPIMGMTCNDFMVLANNHGFDTMTYLLAKFFFHSYFVMSRGYDRICKINLLKGSNLHFLNWISLQNIYGFFYQSALSEIMNYYYGSSDDENDSKEEEEKETENKEYLVEFTPEFFEKNTKFFGNSPTKIETNIFNDMMDAKVSDKQIPNVSDDPPSEILPINPELEVFG